jgi:hypothetical protein
MDYIITRTEHYSTRVVDHSGDKRSAMSIADAMSANSVWLGMYGRAYTVINSATGETVYTVTDTLAVV